MSEEGIPDYLKGMNPIDGQIAEVQRLIKELRGSNDPEKNRKMAELNTRLSSLWDEKTRPKGTSRPTTSYTTPEQMNKDFEERKAQAAKLNEANRSKKYQDTRR